MSTTSYTPAFPDSPSGIGDINSTDKGSGARFNAGKRRWDLVPLYMLAEAFGTREAGDALCNLSCFQARQGDDIVSLKAVLMCLGAGGWKECADVFEYGQTKYAAWNWTRGMPWSAVIGSCARHLLAMAAGEAHDPESGLPHRGHVFCNVVMLRTYLNTYPEGDDRAPEGSLA